MAAPQRGPRRDRRREVVLHEPDRDVHVVAPRRPSWTRGTIGRTGILAAIALALVIGLAAAGLGMRSREPARASGALWLDLDTPTSAAAGPSGPETSAD